MTPQRISVISDSDLVPTHSDELNNVTRMELARADVTVSDMTLNDDVFAEDTIEAPARSDAPTLL